MKISILKSVLVLLFMLCILTSGLYLKNSFGAKKDRWIFVNASNLIDEPEKYVGQKVRTMGILVPINEDSEFPELRLFPFKEYLSIERNFHEQITIRIEFKESMGVVRLPEHCLGRYVVLGGVIGEYVLPGLAAIKEVELVTLVERKENENGLCQFVKRELNGN